MFETAEADSEQLILDVFRWQAQQIPVYKEFLRLLKTDVDAIQSIKAIPFLPIELFRSFDILADGMNSSKQFRSSTTTGSIPSVHNVADMGLYLQSFSKGFRQFYGEPSEFCILALLPSYLERNDSSLVFMVEGLMKKSGHSKNGFYLNDTDSLIETLKNLEATNTPTLLIGVTFALLDLAEQFQLPLTNTIVMETGGMKGRRKEMTRDEVHAVLRNAFGQTNIHSEYGMTELLSQAYSKGNGRFACPPWMKVMASDLTDPLTLLPAGASGSLNIIDLANLYSCSFLASSDLGKVYEDGSFEVLGRVDRSTVRGCNLMVL